MTDGLLVTLQKLKYKLTNSGERVNCFRNFKYQNIVLILLSQ